MSAPLRVCVDATALVKRPTGVGNYTRALLAPMCRAHPEADFILLSNEEVFFDDLPNVRTRHSRPKRRGPHWQNTHLRIMLAEERPDVFWAANGLLPLTRPRGMATVVTINDLVYRFAPETMPFVSRWGRRLGQRHSVAVADRILTISQATADDMVRYYGRGADVLLPPLADPSLHRPDAAAIAEVLQRLNLTQPYLFVLGTLEPRKNIVQLIDAYLNRRKAGVELPQLAIAGGKGWLDSDIAERLSEGEAHGLVRRLGYVDLADLPALFAGCHVFLMPSLYEGFGMPLLEAQVCGAPVVHGPHASMHEAAGQLGVQTPTERDGIERMLDQLAAGELPLACRLPNDIRNDHEGMAAQLWSLMMDARARPGRLAR